MKVTIFHTYFLHHVPHQFSAIFSPFSTADFPHLFLQNYLLHDIPLPTRLPKLLVTWTFAQTLSGPRYLMYSRPGIPVSPNITADSTYNLVFQFPWTLPWTLPQTLKNLVFQFLQTLPWVPPQTYPESTVNPTPNLTTNPIPNLTPNSTPNFIWTLPQTFHQTVSGTEISIDLPESYWFASHHPIPKC